jgi:serpin B
MESIIAPSTPIAQGSNTFGFDLYGQLRATTGNVFLSPINISSALGMAAVGAKGETLDEMLKVLHLPKGDDLSKGFADLLNQLQADAKTPYELSLAAAIWGQESLPFEQSYLNRVSQGFGSGLRRVNFKDKETAVKMINSWVEQQTKNRIQDLLTTDNISPLTRMVLTSAIYFKGQWQYKFNKAATRNEPFWTAVDQQASVPMMYQPVNARYFADETLQLVELPYKGDRLSMVVVLPKAKDGLSKLEATLTAAAVNEGIAAARAMDGDVAMPRFEFTTRYQLPDPLRALGMKKAFGAGADFSGITTAEPLFISDVIHKAFIKVDEEGSEAAAATAVIMDRAPSPVRQRFNFRADHPFVFLIRDRHTETVLFVGRYSGPTN